MTADTFLRVCQRQITAGNSIWVSTLLQQALAKITAGGGEIAVMESGGLNGKTFGRRVMMDCVTVADIAGAALDQDDGDNEMVPASTFDFSELGTDGV